MIKKYRNPMIKDFKASSEFGLCPLNNGKPFEISEQRILLRYYFRLIRMCRGEFDEAETRGREICVES